MEFHYCWYSSNSPPDLGIVLPAKLSYFLMNQTSMLVLSVRSQKSILERLINISKKLYNHD